MTTIIETEKNWVKNYLIPNILENGTLIKDYSSSLDNNKNFNLRDISIAFISTAEAFMLTKCYRLKIDYEYNGKEYSTKLIVKKTPEIPEDTYNGIGFDALFHNEILGYTKIIPLLNTSIYSSKYYFSNRKHLEATLVLSDFSCDGWNMTKSRVNLSLEHIKLAVSALGQFHGASYALKYNETKKFNEICSSLRETRYLGTYEGEWKIICTRSSERAILAAKQYQNDYNVIIPDKFYDNLLKLIHDIQEYGKKRVQPIEPIATICHGDYLRNNIAFKYSDKDLNVPIDITIFDFQTLRYSSPMVDLTVLLSLSAGKDVRPKHFDEIFNTYRNELIKIFCERTQFTKDNLPSHLSYDSLLKEYISYLPFGLGIASSFLMALFDPEDFPVEEMMKGNNRTEEETLKDIFSKGGKELDLELSALVHELYEFMVKNNVNIFEGFI